MKALIKYIFNEFSRGSQTEILSWIIYCRVSNYTSLMQFSQQGAEIYETKRSGAPRKVYWCPRNSTRGCVTSCDARRRSDKQWLRCSSVEHKGWSHAVALELNPSVQTPEVAPSVVRLHLWELTRLLRYKRQRPHLTPNQEHEKLLVSVSGRRVIQGNSSDRFIKAAPSAKTSYFTEEWFNQWPEMLLTATTCSIHIIYNTYINVQIPKKPALN